MTLLVLIGLMAGTALVMAFIVVSTITGAVLAMDLDDVELLNCVDNTFGPETHNENKQS